MDDLASRIDAALAELNALAVEWCGSTGEGPIKGPHSIRRALWFGAPALAQMVQSPFARPEKRRPLSAATRARRLAEWLDAVGPVSGFQDLLDKYREAHGFKASKKDLVELLGLIGARVDGDRVVLPESDFLR